MKQASCHQSRRIVVAIVLLSAIFQAYIFGQTFALSGEIVLKSKQNNRFAPLKGVRVSGGNANPQYSTDDGSFILYIPDAKPGDFVKLTLQLDGYEVYQGSDNLHFETFLPQPRGKVTIVMIRSAEIKFEIEQVTRQLNKKIGENENKIIQLVSENQYLKGPERQRMQATIDSLKGVMDRYRDNRGAIAQAIVYADLDDAPDFVKAANLVFKTTGDLDEALKILETSDVEINTLRDEGERKLKQAKIAALTRARFELANFDFKSAYRYYLKALEIDSTDIGVLLEVADFREQAMDFERAVYFNQKALRQVRFEEDSAMILGLMGRCYLNLEHYAEAERHLEHAIGIYYRTPERYRGELRPAFVLASNQLGIVYERYDEDFRADSLYRRALPVAEVLAKEAPEKYMGYLGDLYRSAGVMRTLFGEKEKSLQFFQKSQAIYKKLADEGQTKYMAKLPWGYGAIGLRYYFLEKNDSAKLFLQTSLDYARNLYAKNPDAYVLHLIGELIRHADYYQYEGMPTIGKRYYVEADSSLQALDDRQKDLYKSTYAGLLNKLAAYLDSNTEYERQAEMEKTSNEIYRQINKKSPKAYRRHLAGASRSLAVTALNDRDYVTAESYANEVLRIWQALEQSNPTFYTDEIARAHTLLGLILLAKPDMERSLDNTQKGIAILEELARENPTKYSGQLVDALGILSLYYTFNNENIKRYEVEKRQIKLLEYLYAQDSSYASSLAEALMGFYSRSHIPINEREKQLERVEAMVKLLANRDFMFYGPMLADCLLQISDLHNAHDNAEQMKKHLQEALAVYERLERERPGVYYDKLANCYSRFAGICDEEKDIPAARAYYQKAIDITKASNAKDPVGFRLSALLNFQESMALMLQNAQEYQEAERIFLETHTGRKRLADQQGGLHQVSYFYSCLHLGSFYTDTRNWTKAREFLNESMSLANKQAQANPGDSESDKRLASVWNQYGILYLDQNNQAGADSCFQAYTKIYRTLAQKDTARYVSDLLVGMNNLAITRTALGDLETALTLRQEVVERIEKLYQQYPQRYAESLALYYRNLSDAHTKLNQHILAAILMEKSLRLYDTLYARKPVEISGKYIGALLEGGNILLTLHDYEKSGDWLQKASKLQKENFLKSPNVETANMANAYNYLGTYHKAMSKMTDARFNFQESIKLYESLLKGDPTSAESNLTFPSLNLALLQAQHEEWKPAEENLKRATELRKKLLAKSPEAYQDDGAHCQNAWGKHHRHKKEYKKAAQYHEKALVIFRIEAAKSKAAYLPIVAQTLSAAAEAHEKNGKHDIADAYFDEALKIQREAAKSEPRAFQPDLAFTLHRHGVLLKKIGKSDQAIVLLKEAYQIRQRYAEETPEAFNFYLAQTALVLASLPDATPLGHYQKVAAETMNVYPKTHIFYRLYAQLLQEPE